VLQPTLISIDEVSTDVVCGLCGENILVHEEYAADSVAV